eukprot:CAMPEP_0117675254 /NCGR_PEP_ID=MMETSP0804-20121206/15502_1 /TAXON_ID=1074897 /ORGANISM="Tetraselmis astigmatica, Strain CCMP880" /LENGTH=275 /DNA_ID=CAMNT_0005484235 /DNA_START=1 /DNA_END=828 /DNA_ORIENTATION=+
MRASFRIVALAVFLAAALPAATRVAASEECCDALGWDVGFGSASVCSSADIPETGCKRNVKGKKANRICKSVGSRLCTLEELEKKESKGAGCGLNNRLVWTSTSRCDGPGTAWVAKGKNGNGKECFPRNDPTKKAGVICCADACDESPSPSPSGDVDEIFYVGAGDFAPPFFKFFEDEDGEVAVADDVPTLEAGKTYRFERIVNDGFHPFGIGASPFSALPDCFDDLAEGSSTRLTAVGQFMQFTVPAQTGDCPPEALVYFCWNHATMQSNLPIE